MELQQNELERVIAPLKKVTPLSNYLGMALLIILPFVGGYIGYRLAAEKVIEVEVTNPGKSAPKVSIAYKKLNVATNDNIQVGTKIQFYADDLSFGTDINMYPGQYVLTFDDLHKLLHVNQDIDCEGCKMNVLKLDNKHVVIGVESSEGVGPSESFLYDEQDNTITELPKFLDELFYQFSGAQIYLVQNHEPDAVGGLNQAKFLNVTKNTLSVYDIVNSTSSIIYTETRSGKTLFGFCEGKGCGSFYSVDPLGSVRLQIFSEEGDFLDSGIYKYLETVQVPLPSEYQTQL